MPESPVGHVMYRVWWAGGGYSHVDELPPDPSTLKHRDPSRDTDEPARIDKVEIVYYDDLAEYRYEKKRLDRILGSGR